MQVLNEESDQEGNFEAKNLSSESHKISSKYAITFLALSIIQILFALLSVFINIWYLAIPSYALFAVNFILFLIFMKQTKSKRPLFIVGTVLALSSLFIPIIGFLTPMMPHDYQINVLNVVGGEIEITDCQKNEKYESTYSTKNGNTFNLIIHPYGGYEFDSIDYIDTNSHLPITIEHIETFDVYSIIYSIVMPSCDITVVPHFKFIGFFIDITTLSDLGDISYNIVSGSATSIEVLPIETYLEETMIWASEPIIIEIMANSYSENISLVLDTLTSTAYSPIKEVYNVNNLIITWDAISELYIYLTNIYVTNN